MNNSSATKQQFPKATVVVENQAPGYTSQVGVGRHRFISDEPKPEGEDQGPNPYDFLLTSLGTCVAMTLRMYAKRKGWDLQRVTVGLSHTQVHSKDCEDCESKEGYVDIIYKEVFLEGKLDEKQRARLMEIADRCPVHKTLVTETKIRTREV